MNSKNLIATKKQILTRIEVSENIAILVSDPDADAIGSGLALEEILNQLNKNAKLFSSYDMKSFSFLPGFENLNVTDISEADLSAFDTIVFLDSAEPFRVLTPGKRNEDLQIPKNSTTINIDHHKSNTLFADINYIAHTASTAEELFEIFENKIKLTSSLATNLLAAIIGDTGSFKYPYTRPQTLRIAAELIEAGAEHQKIIHNLFFSTPLDITKLNINALHNMKIDKAGKYKFAYTIFRKTDNSKNVKIEKTSREQLIIVKETMRSIKGIDFVFIMTPLKEKYTKLSFRSRTVEIVRIARNFGGGGHPGAAGATVKMTPEETLKKLKEFLKKTTLKKILDN